MWVHQGAMRGAPQQQPPHQRDVHLRPMALQAKPEAGPGWFLQRYYVCDEHWSRPDPASSGAAPGASEPGPIFFYVGNEADVTLYLNHSGLMWENAESFGALLVFAGAGHRTRGGVWWRTHAPGVAAAAPISSAGLQRGACCALGAPCRQPPCRPLCRAPLLRAVQALPKEAQGPHGLPDIRTGAGRWVGCAPGVRPHPACIVARSTHAQRELCSGGTAAGAAGM